MKTLHTVVYAVDLARVAAFYESVLGWPRVENTQSFVLLDGGACELSVVQVPPDVAAGIVLAEPPAVREETPIKLSFAVTDFEAARQAADAGGGRLKPTDTAWAWRGCLHLDGVDPEGNVFQLRRPC